MNSHLKLVLEELLGEQEGLFPDYISGEKKKEISTLEYRRIINKIKPLLEEHDELIRKIKDYNMVSYDRETIIKVLRTKINYGLTLHETTKMFGVSKNTIISWEKKLKNDPDMMTEVMKG